MTNQPIFAPPNPDFLAIARLYLEKYETLADEDRKLYRGMLLQMANPLMIVQKEGIDWESLKKSSNATIHAQNAMFHVETSEVSE